MTTILETYVHSFADNAMPVLCSDSVLPTTGAGICTVGTDFIFDAMNADCYAAGVLPAVGAAVPTAGLVNLARNTAPAINEAAIPRGAVTAVESTAAGVAASPTFDGKGWQIGVTKRPFEIRKVGIANNRVNEAVLEGFKDVLELVWFRIVAVSSDYGMGLLSAGRSSVAGSVGIYTVGAGVSIAAAGATAGNAPLGTLHQAGVLCRYNTGAQTMTATPVFDGVVGVAIAAVSVAAAVGNDSNSLANIGTFTGFNVASANIVVYRVVREYVGVTAMTPTQIAAYVAKDYAYGAARFS